MTIMVTEHKLTVLFKCFLLKLYYILELLHKIAELQNSTQKLWDLKVT